MSDMLHDDLEKQAQANYERAVEHMQSATEFINTKIPGAKFKWSLNSENPLSMPILDLGVTALPTAPNHMLQYVNAYGGGAIEVSNAYRALTGEGLHVISDYSQLPPHTNFLNAFIAGARNQHKDTLVKISLSMPIITGTTGKLANSASLLGLLRSAGLDIKALAFIKTREETYQYIAEAHRRINSK